MSVLLRTYPLIPLRAKPPLTLFFPSTLKPFFLLPKSLSQSRSRFSASASASACPISSSNNPSPSPHESLIQPPKPPLSHKETLDWVKPTGFCGELSLDEVEKGIRLCGWVALHRVHGGLTFFNLRHHSGVVQVTTLPDYFPDAHSTVSYLRLEYVISVEGCVRQRPSESINKKMKTGYIEVASEHVQVLNTVKSKLPFLITTADDAKDSAKEEIRLRYRCLDLRREQMKSNMILPHNVLKLIRRYLEDVHGFVEPGTFYSLPQSPQLFKQMLMVSGFDKYYQVARCFQDEDLRADRQPEFTQLDMELAFTPLEDMLRLNEDLIRKVFLEIKGVHLPNPFPRLTYAEAMSRYGSDRPDLRFDLELKDASDIFSDSPFRVFSDTLKSGGSLKFYVCPQVLKNIQTQLSRKAIFIIKRSNLERRVCLF